MTFAEKIEEWIKEAEIRPGSALMILKLIAGRLRDLSERNEELASENIALQDGSRVKEYQERITHLEFQLELLKRRFGEVDDPFQVLQPGTATTSLLIFDTLGHILRYQFIEQELAVQPDFGVVQGTLTRDGETARLLAVSTEEQILLLFSSGRVETFRVEEIPVSDRMGAHDLERAFIPDPPHAGELLVDLMPLSRMPVSTFFLQASRRGAVKKTLGTIFDKVLSSHYLGRGTVQKNDQPFVVTLGEKKDRFAMVTSEGHVLCLDADGLFFTAEERIRLEVTDRVVSGFIPGEDDLIICVTQNGKILQRPGSSLEVTKSPNSHGQSLISPSRLEQGTRFVGAVSSRQDGWLVTLDRQGRVKAHSVKAVCGAGSLGGESEFIALCAFLSAHSAGIKS